VPYEEFDVSTNIEKRTYMMEKSGQRGVPVITIDEDLVVGFNQPVIAKLLDIK
jgi:glutaredoxin